MGKKAIAYNSLAVILLAATPCYAFPTVSCDGPNSGFIEVGSQRECLRVMSPEEVQRAREAAQMRAYERRRQRRIAEAEARRDQAERAMDIAGNNIMGPNGRPNYRRALDNYTDASVELKQLTR